MAHGPTNLDSWFSDSKADYKSARRSSPHMRKRRGVPSLGAGADYHYRSESDYLWMGEAARDAYRNDMLIGSIVDRAVNYTVQSGFRPNPNTGDADLDAELVTRWDEEAVDPQLCDPGGQLTFADQESMVCREEIVAGDVFGVPIDDGTTQLVEFHRCRSPQRKGKQNDKIIHGVEFASSTSRRRKAYWFTREPVSPYTTVHRKDLDPYAAFDSDGEPMVWHNYWQRRPSQTRGVTALQPIFDAISYHDDIHFATLLKQQLSAFFLLVRNREKGFFENQPHRKPAGPESVSPSGRRLMEDLAPGAEIEGLPGEQVAAWSPNIPSESWFEHMKLVLTLIGVNLGMPLVMTLMDASESNFSGFRGAVDQARMGWRERQQRLIRNWHRPSWRHRLHFWANSDPALARRRLALGAAYTRHTWDPPGWNYLEPNKDATADLVRESNLLISPRRRCAERGWEWDTLVRETVEDRAFAIDLAVQKAAELNKTHKLEGEQALRWRDLAPLPAPERVSIAFNDPATGVEPPTPAPRQPA